LKFFFEDSLLKLGFVLKMIVIFLALTSCDFFKNKKAEESQNPLPSKERQIVIQKRQGLNVGESQFIWVVGMLRNPNSSTMALNVDRISLKPGDHYKKKSLVIPQSGDLGASPNGSRTFVSDFGLLIGRSGNSSSGEFAAVSLIVVDPEVEQYRSLLTVEDGEPGTRATVFSYKTHINERAYDFVAIAYRKQNQSVRIERFLVQSSQPFLEGRFLRVRPYEYPNSLSPSAVYSGFLFPNCLAQNNCQPIFYGTTRGIDVDGYTLQADVPPTPYSVNSSFLTPPIVQRPNLQFQSTSHSSLMAGSIFGNINSSVYSMGGDPDDGWVYLASEDDEFANNSFVAYDKTNQVVFRTARNSRMGASGFNPENPRRSIVTLFKRECFFDASYRDCSPVSTAHSKVFDDVGESIGPASDLGNGCVAILDWRRPSEAQGNDFRPGVYSACIRDPNNLSKGLSVTKIAESVGATYMYNDFTGSMLSDRPNRIIFDFSERQISSFKRAQFFWSPKLGYSSDVVGLKVQYRCFKKAESENPPPFRFLDPLPKAGDFMIFPQCGNHQHNIVELEVSRIPRQRFTRFDLISVSAFVDR
jgi:hypothetical protein